MKKEEGTATVIDGSDDEWNRRGPLRLYSVNDKGPVSGNYLYAKKIKDGKEEITVLRADGTKDNEATGLTGHIIQAADDVIVILELINTVTEKEKVVAIDKENDTLTVKEFPSGTLGKLNNLEDAKSHQEFLFYKMSKGGP
ncbi:hypothetical protein AWC38_SpisGene23808 [Stylophora pistillata]|uniref:Uncharacterized protein n=1 Tax=Stylophora pistillata TaxID=50429 RepID=A0A2B4R7Q5_STYPI|nr:hypothetical protein AWC38_SpisGene23808 [Stylophora pistillata]